MFLFCAFHHSSRPARGASGGVWLQGGIGERGFGWRQPDLREAVVRGAKGREVQAPKGLMRCPDRGGHVPRSRVLTDDRDRRGCQARPREAGSRPSSPGGPRAGSAPRGFVPGMRFRSEVNPPGEVRAQALEALGRQPSLEHRSAGPGTKATAVRGAAGPRGAGLPACFPPGLAAGADRASRPLFLFKRKRRSEGPNPRAERLRGYSCSSVRTVARPWRPTARGARSGGFCRSPRSSCSRPPLSRAPRARSRPRAARIPPAHAPRRPA